MSRRGAVAGLALCLLAVGCARVEPPRAPSAPLPASPPASAPATATGPATPASPATAATCDALAAGLTPAQQAGQLVMVGVTGALDSAERAAITDHHLGSALLLGNSTAGVDATRATVDAILALAGPAGLVVAADQEGGRVQRLSGPGFATIPSASEQATWTPVELEARAQQWGTELAAAGVLLNLAPVADVVPADKVATNEPIGRLGRGYGPTPEGVAERVEAVVNGLHAAGVATSAKHFPNLGQVVGNTDFTAGVTDTVTTRDDPALAPYRAAIAAGTETVMLSTARYTLIDPDAPAAFSPAVVGMLREGLGFPGVIVSDDLGVAAAVQEVPASERAVRLVRAGGDLAISADPASAVAMARGLVAAAAQDPAFAARVQESAARVVALKGGLGAARCEPVAG